MTAEFSYSMTPVLLVDVVPAGCAWAFFHTEESARQSIGCPPLAA